MTVTAVIGSNVTAVVGPGIEVLLSTSTLGPYPIDDMWFVDVVATAGPLNGLSIYRGDASARGYQTGSVVLGVRERTSTASTIHSFHLPGAVYGIDAADGQACRLDLTLYHYNFTVVDTGTLTGLTWTRIGNLSMLMAGLLDVQQQQQLARYFPPNA